MNKFKNRPLSDLYNNKNKSEKIKKWIREKHRLLKWVVVGIVLASTLIINTDTLVQLYDKYNQKSPSFFYKADSYKILLLPFGSSQSCANENIICERELQNRFQLLSKDDSLLNIEVKILDGVNSKSHATSYERARELGDSLGANIIIWGDYKNKCDWDSTKIRVKYSIIRDSIFFIKEQTNEMYESISDISQIEEGVLTGNIEDLVYIILGLKAHNKERNLKKAIYYLKKVNLKTKLEYANIYSIIGTNYMVIGINENKIFFDSAEYYLNQALEIDSSQKGPYFNRGVLYKEQKRFYEAVSDFSKVIEFEPENILAYNYRGNILVEQKQYSRAILDFNESIKLDSTNSDIYKLLGNIYFEMNDNSKALFNYNKAILLDPTNASAIANRGIIYGKIGNLFLALIELNKADKIKPENSYIIYNRGTTNLMLGRVDQALEDFTKTIQIDSTFKSAYQNRSSIYLWKNDIQNYNADIKRINQLDKTK